MFTDNSMDWHVSSPRRNYCGFNFLQEPLGINAFFSGFSPQIVPIILVSVAWDGGS